MSAPRPRMMTPPPQMMTQNQMTIEQESRHHDLPPPPPRMLPHHEVNGEWGAPWREQKTTLREHEPTAAASPPPRMRTTGRASCHPKHHGPVASGMPTEQPLNCAAASAGAELAADADCETTSAAVEKLEGRGNSHHALEDPRDHGCRMSAGE